MSENKNFFRASAEDFKKIPGSPVAYWLSDKLIDSFSSFPMLYSVAPTKQGLATGDNDRFLRRWFETGLNNTSIGLLPDDVGFTSKKWFPCNKGGEFRKWYGNLDYLVNWSNSGKEIKLFYDSNGKLRSRPQNENFYFKKGLTWSAISSGKLAMRYSSEGTMFETKGAMCFPPCNKLTAALGFLNSCVVCDLLKAMAPTLDFHEGPIGRLPFAIPNQETAYVNRCIELSKDDWDGSEVSWDFTGNPLLAARNVSGASDESEFQLSALYAAVREKWAKDCEEMRRLETENNRIFIEAYGLQDELTPEVPWQEITLTCNPWYRYRAECGVQSAELPRDGKLEERLKGDTVKELISYAVGCMMGRYSLEKPGLILADQGATVADYWEKVGRSNSDSSEATLTLRQTSEMRNVSGASDKSELIFEPDDDGIIPILDNDWFADDIVTRFKEFIKVAFGEEHFFENMAWIEEALGKNLRDYFTKDFYKDHLQRYQNRPIYWLFQSPKGAFRALVYMHRYKPDMVGGVLGYLRSLQTKIDNQLDVAMQIGADESKSSSARVRANKDAVKYAKVKKELDEYEKNVLYPLSTERIEIDLDDGVKANYKKFGTALRKVAALEERSAE